jgi:DNA primase
MASGYFPEELIRRIRQESDLVGLVSQYVSLKKSGQNYVGLCPFHSEKTPSFVVSPTKQVFHCFGCHVGGDALGFLMKIEGRAFPEAVRFLGEKLGIKLPSRKEAAPDPKQDEERQALYKIHEEAMEHFHKTLLSNPQARSARDYLIRRGIRPETIEAFRLGFALPSWDALQTSLAKAGWTASQLEQAGLVLPRDENRPGSKGFYDRFRNRLIFPIWDLQGRVCAFGGRVLGQEDGPKYLNSPETPIFSKGKQLYAMEKAREFVNKSGYLVVVEGYFDAITAHQSGIRTVVATLGTALTDSHLQLIKRFAPKVKLIFDSDTAGIRATLRAADVIIPSGLPADAVLLPEGQDPDSFIQAQGAGAFVGLLTQGIKLMDFAIEQCMASPDIRTIDGKLRIIETVLPTIQKISNPIERKYYLKKLAEVLDVNEQDLLVEPAVRRTAGPDSKGVSSPPVLVPLPKEEEVLIHLILHHRLSVDHLLKEIQPEDFSDSRAKRILENVVESFRASGTVRLQDILPQEAAAPELAAHLTALSVKEPDYEDLSQTIADCIRAVKHRRLRSSMKNLERQIRLAEQEGRPELVRSLQVQLLGLKRMSLGIDG